MQDQDYSFLDGFSALISDLDGTLIDSEGIHLEAWNEICRKYGLEQMTYEYIKSIGGIRTVNISKMLCEKKGGNLDFEAIAREKTELYRSSYMQKVEVFPEIAAILQKAREKGLKIAVATGSQQMETRYLLERHHLMGIVDAIVSSDMIKNSKPDPETYLVASERLGTPPKKCLVLEDTPVGLAGVKAAGMTCLRVQDGRISGDLIKP